MSGDRPRTYFCSKFRRKYHPGWRKSKIYEGMVTGDSFFKEGGGKGKVFMSFYTGWIGRTVLGERFDA